MSQPHLCRLGRPGQAGRLIHGHVLIFSGFGLLSVLAVHPLTDKKIRLFCIFGNDRNRPCVGTVGDTDSLPRRAQNHIRSQRPLSVLHRLPLLESVPVFLGDLLLPGPLHVKSAFSRNGNRISITRYVVVHLIGIYYVRSDLKLLSRLRQFYKTEGKRQLRRNRPKRSHHSFKALRPNHNHRLRSLSIAHGQQKSRQAADMIRMVMGKTYHIHRLRTPSLFLQRYLRTFSAVY